MENLEEEAKRVIKKQKISGELILEQLDLLLEHVETTNTSLTSDTKEEEQVKEKEMEQLIQDFIVRIQALNINQKITLELKNIHLVLSKYSKLIDKTFCNDITKICDAKQFDHSIVCRLIAEHLYQAGQIEVADQFCQEAEVDISPLFKQCFTELGIILDALRIKDIKPAIEWARRHQKELEYLDLDVEFELIRLKYLDVLQQNADPNEAIQFARKEFGRFHGTHTKVIGRLMSCLLFKNNLHSSPYKDLFHDHCWEEVASIVIRACCRLYEIPYRAYLDTCLQAGFSVLPVMRKLIAVMENNLTNWKNMDEFPVEFPVHDEFRFHTVFTCPVSKEESTPENPPILLKCGHVICKTCVKKISYNFSRRFKCPTCPMEQKESDTKEIYF